MSGEKIGDAIGKLLRAFMFGLFLYKSGTNQWLVLAGSYWSLFWDAK